MTEERETMTDDEFNAACAAMRAGGLAGGRAAGTWIADGNTSRMALEGMVRAFDGDADPDTVSAPSPFSGEWGGDPTAEDKIAEHTDCDPDTLTPEERDELASAYEEGFYEGWNESAERTVRGLLGEE
jgi:hypothetical protein